MEKAFEPQTIEITRKLEFGDQGEESIERLRKTAFDTEAEDAILKRVLGANAARARVTILWGRFQQFVQTIVIPRVDDASTPTGPTRTDEITTRYRVEPGS